MGLKKWPGIINHEFPYAERKKAAGVIPGHALVKLHTDGTYLVGDSESVNIVGANQSHAAVALGGRLVLQTEHEVTLYADGPLSVQERLKCYAGGRAGRYMNATYAAATIKSGVGGDFANQPTNDGIEVLSSSALDITQTVTVWGTTNGGNVVVKETVALSGTDVVPSVKVDWGEILGVELSAACVGTVTVQEASAHADIITIAPAALTAGILEVAAADRSCYDNIPTVEAAAASTKKIAVIGYSVADALVEIGANNCVVLNGTTPVDLGAAFNRITRLLVGDVAAASTVTLKTDDTADTDTEMIVGRALTAAAARGSEFQAALRLAR